MTLWHVIAAVALFFGLCAVASLIFSGDGYHGDDDGRWEATHDE